MLVIRPTLSLAKRLKVKLATTDVESSTRLGDWYAIDIVLKRRQFILAVSAKSRVSVMIEAAPYVTFPDRLPLAIREVLSSIGLKREKIESEINEMNQILLAKTQDRSVIGTMNDYRRHLQFMENSGRFNPNNLLAVSLQITATPSLVMPGVWPQEVALQLFGEPPLNKLVRAPLQTPNLYLVK